MAETGTAVLIDPVREQVDHDLTLLDEPGLAESVPASENRRKLPAAEPAKPQRT